MNPPFPRIVAVSGARLRSIFNESQYPELISKNALQKIVLRSKVLDEKELCKRGWPIGTKSEIIVYRDRANGLYTKVHQYLLPDGTIGASGKLDPKSVLIDEIMYNYNPNC